jgi:pyruvate dehydrogenase E2 component (dihydrolipoamide acetyltransferase)
MKVAGLSASFEDLAGINVMDFLVPKLSATMESVKVLRWLKQVGDKVAVGEPLVELETDKAAMEVESPVEATLEEPLAAEGAELPVGAVLARLGTAGEGALASSTKPSPATIRDAPDNAAEPAIAASGSVGAAAPRILASPFARRLAAMKGTDLAALAAAKPLQRIRGRDVLAAAEARDARETSLVPSIGFEPLSALRRQIAEAVTLSRRTIPSFVIDRWVEATAMDQARAACGVQIEATVGVRPTFTDFLLVALIDALSQHPRILDRWHEEDGRAGRIRASNVDIGLVVAVSDGVMIPVLRMLAGKSVHEIVQARHDAVQRARSGRLLQADYAPVSFSLSNIGKSGADRFEAIINPGHSSILAVGRQHDRVIARSGGIAVAKGVNLTLTVDHRLIDGRLGAEFMATLAERIEHGPWSST